MKRKLLLSLLIFALVCSTCTFAACKIKPEHSCTFGEWQTRTEADCTHDGLMYRTCECGEEQTEIVPAKGHTEGDWITDKQATCAEEGSKHKECTVCHVSVATESIPTSDNHALCIL